MQLVTIRELGTPSLTFPTRELHAVKCGKSTEYTTHKIWNSSPKESSNMGSPSNAGAEAERNTR